MTKSSKQRKSKMQKGKKTPQQRQKQAVKPAQANAGARASKRLAQAPVAYASVIRTSKQANVCRQHVSERITAVQIDADTPVGLPLAQIFLNPLTWTGTRIGQEAGLWQQFRFTKLRFWAEPAIPAICAGQYIHGCDSEAQNMDLDGEDLVTYLATLPGSAMAAVYKDSAADCPVDAYLRSQQWYKLEGSQSELPDYCQGLYILALSQKFSGVTSGLGGITIRVEGEIEFSGRRVQQQKGPETGTVINAGIQYKVGSGTDGVPAGKYVYQGGHGNDFAQLLRGYAYVPLPELLCVPNVQSGSPGETPVQAMRVHDNGDLYFYASLAGAMTLDETELCVSDAAHKDTIYSTGGSDMLTGFAHAVKVPTTTRLSANRAKSAVTFRAPSKAAQPTSKGSERANQIEGAGIAALVATVVSELAGLGIFGLGSASSGQAKPDSGGASSHA